MQAVLHQHPADETGRAARPCTIARVLCTIPPQKENTHAFVCTSGYIPTSDQSQHGYVCVHLERTRTRTRNLSCHSASGSVRPVSGTIMHSFITLVCRITRSTYGRWNSSSYAVTIACACLCGKNVKIAPRDSIRTAWICRHVIVFCFCPRRDSDGMLERVVAPPQTRTALEPLASTLADANPCSPALDSTLTSDSGAMRAEPGGLRAEVGTSCQGSCQPRAERRHLLGRNRQHSHLLGRSAHQDAETWEEKLFFSPFSVAAKKGPSRAPGPSLPSAQALMTYPCRGMARPTPSA